jgi:hypothetical protein
MECCTKMMAMMNAMPMMMMCGGMMMMGCMTQPQAA